MGSFLMNLVLAVVLALPNSVSFSGAAWTQNVSVPDRAQAPTVICNPAWGTIVVPICV